MKKLSSVFILSCLLLSLKVYADPQKIDGAHQTLYFEKLEIEGHTYLHFLPGWAGGLNCLLHDPECITCDAKKTIDVFFAEIKKEFDQCDEVDAINHLTFELKESLMAIQEEMTSKGKKKKKKK